MRDHADLFSAVPEHLAAPGAGGDAAALARRGLSALPAPDPQVAVWMCGLEREPDEVHALAALLAPAEHARAARFGREDLRARYIVGRAALRTLLAHRLGRPAQDIAIERGTRGRPHVVAADGLDFNVSHTAGVALIGFTTGERIGVDIEHRTRPLNVEGVARKFMAEDEQAMLAALAPDARREALLRLWTCKEAMSKATGDALSAPFRGMSVATGAALRLVAGPGAYAPPAWRLLPVAMPGGFLATVALWRHV